MINGFFEYTSLPWEERLGNKVRQINGELIEDFDISHKRIDASILVSTLIKEGKPHKVDTYLFDNSGRPKKITHQLPDKDPHWTYEYEMCDGELYVIRTNLKSEIYKYKIVANRDGQDKIYVVEYREIDTNNVVGMEYAIRDGDGNLIQEIFEDQFEPVKLVRSCDKYGRLLSDEQIENGVLSIKTEYVR